MIISSLEMRNKNGYCDLSNAMCMIYTCAQTHPWWEREVTRDLYLALQLL